MPFEVLKYTTLSSNKPRIQVSTLEDHVQSQGSLLNRNHRAEFYQILLFGDCELTHSVDFEPIGIKPFSLLFIDRERINAFDSNLGYTGHAIMFMDDFFCVSENDVRYLRSNRLFNNPHGAQLILTNRTQYKRFHSLCGYMKHELTLNPDEAQSLITKNLLEIFLLLAERELTLQAPMEGIPGSDLDYVIAYQNLLEQKFRSEKKVSQYSEAMNISERRLGKATQIVLGKTPKELVSDRVLLEAKRMVLHSRQSVKEISFALGFEEPTNFIKFFRKNLGCTPMEFRSSFGTGLWQSTA